MITEVERPAGNRITSAGTHTIIVAETKERRGRFHVTLDGGRSLPASRQPLLDTARLLLSEGENPQDVIRMEYVSKPGVTTLSAKIGVAAKLTIDEGRRGPRLVRWKPFGEVASKVCP